MNRTLQIIVIILFCTFYQDLPLINVFGEIARTPVFILIVPMLIYIFSHKKILISNYTQYFIYYILYLIIVSLIHLAYIVIINQEVVFLKENIIIKTVKMAIYPICALIYYQFFYMYLKNGKNKLNDLLNAIFILQIFFAVYLCFEVYFLKTTTNFLPFLHSTTEKFWKVRMLTSEESFVGNVITFFVFVPIFLVNFLDKSTKAKRGIYFVSTFLFLLFSLVTESKGYLILLLFSILPMISNRIYKDPKYRKYFKYIVPVFVIIIIISIVALKDLFINQLTTSCTFGTRFTSYYSSIKVLIKHPFGVGWSGFIYYYPEEIRNSLDTIFFRSLDLTEIKGYLLTTKALSTKTEFFDGIIYGGLGFIFFYYKFFVQRCFFVFKIKNPVFFTLKIALIFSVLAGVIYINYVIKYEVWFLLALIDVIQNKYQIENQNE